MTNIMQDGATWLAQQLGQSAGRVITYKRGQVTVSLTAVPLMQEYTIVDEDGMTTAIKSYDFLVTSSMVVLFGAIQQPKPGDLITITGESANYEVVPIDGKTCSEPLDVHGTMTTIHTKRVA